MPLVTRSQTDQSSFQSSRVGTVLAAYTDGSVLKAIFLLANKWMPDSNKSVEVSRAVDNNANFKMQARNEKRYTEKPCGWERNAVLWPVRRPTYRDPHICRVVMVMRSTSSLNIAG